MKRSSKSRAFTLAEVAVAGGVTVIVGIIFIFVAHNIAFMTAKNAAINLTHIQARTAIHRAVSEIRDSVSIPQLTDSSLASLGNSMGPAAGVSYQQMVSGPNLVWTTAASGQNQIKISSKAGDPAITVGMRLIVPAFAIEDDITAVTAPSGSPATRTVTLAHALNSTVTAANGTPNIVAYYTQRSALVVVGTDLRYYQMFTTATLAAGASYSIISRNILTPQPFTIPGGDNRFVQAAFTTQDPRILSRGFKAANLQIAMTIPYRYRLTTYQ